MTGGMPVLSGLGAAFILLFFCRCLLGWRGKPAAMEQGAGIGMAQTTGSRQMLFRSGRTGPEQWRY